MVPVCSSRVVCRDLCTYICLCVAEFVVFIWRMIVLWWLLVLFLLFLMLNCADASGHNTAIVLLRLLCLPRNPSSGRTGALAQGTNKRDRPDFRAHEGTNQENQQGEYRSSCCSRPPCLQQRGSCVLLLATQGKARRVARAGGNCTRVTAKSYDFSAAGFCHFISYFEVVLRSSMNFES